MVPDIYAVHWKFFMCTATRTSSYSPVGSVFCAYFVLCLSFLFVCIPILSCFLGQLNHLPYSSWRCVTNLNEPPRALATSTIAWVRS